MISILFDIKMPLMDFNTIKYNVEKDVRYLNFHYFNAWYDFSRGIGHFKINQIYRQLLEKELYIME